MFKFLALALCLGFTSAQVVPGFNQVADLLNTHLSQSIEMSDILNTYNTHVSHPIKMSDILNLNDPPPKTRFECPPAKAIEPCECFRKTHSGACNGAKVTENHITKFFTALRKANKKSDTDTMNMLIFTVAQTKLKTLSMKPFENLNVSALFIISNSQLTTLTASDPNNFDQDVPSQALLTVGGLFLGQNQLTDNTMNGFFSQIDLPSLRVLALNNNRIQGNTELVPGLSDMTDLGWLALDNNQITQISNSPFPNNLLILSMSSNQIESLGTDAFIFSPYPEDHPYANLTSVILLGKNNLGSASGSLSDIPSNSKISDTAFSKITRPALVSLNGNSLDTLLADQFETFLDNSRKSALLLNDNSFQCDSRMQWLKTKRSDYEKRVICADCQNDEGKTIFTTTKV